MMQLAEIVDAMDQAARYEGAGQLATAAALYRNIVAHAPEQHAAWHALGLLAYRGGQLESAAEHIAQAIAQHDAIALYHRNYGELCRRLQRFDAAIAAGLRATELAPDDSEAFYNLALALTDNGCLQEAAAQYREALTLFPQHGLAWNNLGAVLERLDDSAGAEAAYALAVQLDPKHAEAQNNLGAIYTAQGKLTEAIHCFNAAIRARPSFVEAHCNLSILKKYTEDDAHVLVLETLAETLSNASVDDRVRLNFALGKARDDLGDYRGAFTAYALGNALKYRQRAYDERSADATLNAFIETFDKTYFEKQALPVAGSSDRIPIFIVGMPRSGTTLIEQMLASHPALYGAGELSTFNDTLSGALGGHAGPQLVKQAAELAVNNARHCAEEYLTRVWLLAPAHRYITDKMPANYFWIGLIHRLLPQAKIIHARRDPFDVGLSCFTRLFDDPSMAFTYDLEVLGRYYQRYAQLMQHWRDVLPAGSILDVRYEDMVAAPELQIRRMLDFIGLPWHAETLNFHTQQRAVKTASLAQVRQPIYGGSVGRWRHFEAQLAPLVAQVEPIRVAYYP
jgi:Flp pilus assembly protein TadD